MSWWVLLGLVACNMIWATNPVMGKILMESFAPLQVSWLRYSSAFVAAIISLALLRIFRPRKLSSFREVFGSAALPWVFSLGLITFFGSGVTQYLGLSHSTSTANALLVALEPLFAVFLAWVFLREAMKKRQGFAFLLALAGFFLLSNLKPGDVMGTIHLFNFGNLLLLCTMPMEAMYTIISRKLAGRIQPLSLFAGGLSFGFAALTLYVCASGAGLPSYTSLDGRGWLAVLWMGPLGTTLTYVFWSLALGRASVAAVCLTLFVQPILGAAFSALLLGERLDAWQLFGGILILAALALQTTVALAPPKREIL
jgi:drug/metabolite transporter (DMT)-like permease